MLKKIPYTVEKKKDLALETKVFCILCCTYLAEKLTWTFIGLNYFWAPWQVETLLNLNFWTNPQWHHLCASFRLGGWYLLPSLCTFFFFLLGMYTDTETFRILSWNKYTPDSQQEGLIPNQDFLCVVCMFSLCPLPLKTCTYNSLYMPHGARKNRDSVGLSWINHG